MSRRAVWVVPADVELVASVEGESGLQRAPGGPLCTSRRATKSASRGTMRWEVRDGSTGGRRRPLRKELRRHQHVRVRGHRLSAHLPTGYRARLDGARGGHEVRGFTLTEIGAERDDLLIINEEFDRPPLAYRLVASLQEGVAASRRKGLSRACSSGGSRHQPPARGTRPVHPAHCPENLFLRTRNRRAVDAPLPHYPVLAPIAAGRQVCCPGASSRSSRWHARCVSTPRCSSSTR